ncbi:hypothetical protein [Vulcaniibacterium thermophilum]|nr:hypothetical protein [Vulcaniibacterium thermophilum]
MLLVSVALLAAGCRRPPEGEALPVVRPFPLRVGHTAVVQFRIEPLRRDYGAPLLIGLRAPDPPGDVDASADEAEARFDSIRLRLRLWRRTPQGWQPVRLTQDVFVPAIRDWRTVPLENGVTVGAHEVSVDEVAFQAKGLSADPAYSYLTSYSRLVMPAAGLYRLEATLLDRGRAPATGWPVELFVSHPLPAK